METVFTVEYNGYFWFLVVNIEELKTLIKRQFTTEKEAQEIADKLNQAHNGGKDEKAT